jgi:hypothetical protein
VTVQIWGPYATIDDAVTYCSSEQISPTSPGGTVVSGAVSLPAFKSTPNVSAQITTGVGAVMVQIYAVKIVTIPGAVPAVEIAVEATTVPPTPPAAGIYYLNLVVTGVPVDPIAPDQLA